MADELVARCTNRDGVTTALVFTVLLFFMRNAHVVEGSDLSIWLATDKRRAIWA